MAAGMQRWPSAPPPPKATRRLLPAQRWVRHRLRSRSPAQHGRQSPGPRLPDPLHIGALARSPWLPRRGGHRHIHRSNHEGSGQSSPVQQQVETQCSGDQPESHRADAAKGAQQNVEDQK